MNNSDLDRSPAKISGGSPWSFASAAGATAAITAAGGLGGGLGGCCGGGGTASTESCGGDPGVEGDVGVPGSEGVGGPTNGGEGGMFTPATTASLTRCR